MNITNSAKAKLLEYLSEHNAQNIRILFAGYGWGAPKLGLALDEPEETDEVKTVNGITVAIDNRILAMTEELTLDLGEEGIYFTGAPVSDC